MKTALFIAGLLILSSCGKSNKFHDVIRTATQTDKEISVVLVDSVTYLEMWLEDRSTYRMVVETMDDEETKATFQRGIQELDSLIKTDRADYLAGYRVTADLGSDRMIFLVDSAVTKAIIAEEYEE